MGGYRGVALGFKAASFHAIGANLFSTSGGTHLRPVFLGDITSLWKQPPRPIRRRLASIRMARNDAIWSLDRTSCPGRCPGRSKARRDVRRFRPDCGVGSRSLDPPRTHADFRYLRDPDDNPWHPTAFFCSISERKTTGVIDLLQPKLT